MLLADQLQLVWLIAPTVALCTQHAETFSKRLPAYQVRLLLGSDNVDKWSDQSTWNAAFKNIRIVISAPAVLNDALDHAFVKIEQLALLIFDEAHHAVKKNPGAQIMKNHFAIARLRPSILGLTASPAASEKGVKDLEANLCSRIVTPSRCRSELVKYVHRPKLELLQYRHNDVTMPHSLHLLLHTVISYDLASDPWFRSLSSERQLLFSYGKEKTFCATELNNLYNSSNHIFEQLGPEPANSFITAVVLYALDKVESKRPGLAPRWTNAEGNHLADLLRPLLADTRKRKSDGLEERDEDTPTNEYSHKVNELLRFLDSEWTESFTGLIFVQQRALSYALAQLLSKHNFARAKLRVQGFCGNSEHTKRSSSFVEQVMGNLKGQTSALKKFRSSSREINLIVATEVLGEGVDIPQCHLVMCFDLPPRITSYIQRRGRARLRDSKYVLMLEEGHDQHKIADWDTLENTLNDAYLKAEKELGESPLEEEEYAPGSDKEFRVSITGALLNLDNSIPKLSHFCSTLQSGSFVDLRPTFSFEDRGDRNVTATVKLPIVIEPSLRVAQSSRPWRTEKMASRDAAYEALLKLHEAGLLNEHLLPLKQISEPPKVEESQKSDSLSQVFPRINPWQAVAKSIGSMKWHALKISIQCVGQLETTEILLLAPVPLPAVPQFTLFWNKQRRYTVRGEPSSVSIDMDESGVRQLWTSTEKILRSAYGSRMPVGTRDFPFGVRFATKPEQSYPTPEAFSIQDYRKRFASQKPGVVFHDGYKYLFDHFQSIDDLEVAFVTVYPKRRDFGHAIPSDSKSKDAYTKHVALPVAECTFDSLGHEVAMVSLFIPTILRRLELALLTSELQTTPGLLSAVGFEDPLLLQTAITHNQACESEHYQRLEFLGDCILGYLTSLHLMVEKPLWPEGYLTAAKGQRVSNTTLNKACIRTGLDRYIVSDSFTGLKWVPPYVSNLLAAAEKPQVKIIRSKKMLADVIESTIGAAYLDGGLSASVACCKIYFPETIWTMPDLQTPALFPSTSVNDNENNHLGSLEELIGYKFKKSALLLEAITHPSFHFDTASARSYQRLEFLGDSVLDYLIVRRIFAFSRELPHNVMHSIRTATVNSWILGYLCMEHSIAEERNDIVVSGNSNKTTVEKKTVNRYIWQFLRHSQPQDAHGASVTRHQDMRDEIDHALSLEPSYPWALLSRYGPAKLFSDLIESILGAIYIDSNANHDICDAFLETLGLYKILDRILQEDVACMHPKELIGIAAGNRNVQYIWGEDGTLFTCQIKVGGKNVGDVVKGITRDATSCQAALEATKILKVEEQERMARNQADKIKSGLAGDVVGEPVIAAMEEEKSMTYFDAEESLVLDTDGDIQMSQGA